MLAFRHYVVVSLYLFGILTDEVVLEVRQLCAHGGSVRAGLAITDEARVSLDTYERLTRGIGQSHR